MMTLRYIFHSGFLIETTRCILVFDYWMDPADVMSGYMNTCKHVYVFSSHFHEDHFTKEIFKMLSKYKKVRTDRDAPWEDVTKLKYIEELTKTLDV